MTLRVRQVMAEAVFALDPGTSIDTAIELFKTHRISGAPVIGSDRRPVGVLSLFDLVEIQPNDSGIGHRMYYQIRGEYVVSHDDRSEGARGPIDRLMSKEVHTVEAATTVLVAAERMLDLGVHRLLVVDEGRLVGIVSSNDLLRAALAIATGASDETL